MPVYTVIVMSGNDMAITIDFGSFVVQGPDLLEDSSELIYAGEMNKVNSAGWSQERNFFLFDHQLVYCKKVTNYCFVSN